MSSGSAVFKSLRLLGKPSGPHRLRFTATIQVGETSSFGTSRRYLDSSASHFNVMIGKCPSEKPRVVGTECTKADWKLPGDCKPDEYLDDTDADKYKHNCVRCPPGGYCDKTTTLSTLRPLSGWWRIPENEMWDDAKEMFARCLYPEACLGLARQPRRPRHDKCPATQRARRGTIPAHVRYGVYTA